MHAFAVGGVAVQYAALARALQRQGHRVTVVAEEGAAADSLPWGSARLCRIKGWNAAALRSIVGWVATHDVTVAMLSRDTAIALPWLLAKNRAVMTVHGEATLMEEWLGPNRLELLRCLLRRRHTLRVLTAGDNHNAGLAALFRTSVSRFDLFPHVLEPTGPCGSHPTDATARILCPVRLSMDKWASVEAAANLAIVAKRGLSVVGTGAAREAFEARLRGRSDLDWEVIEDADVQAHMWPGRVAVATGVTALEALARGCDVAVPSQVVPGAFCDVVRVSNFDGMYRNCFVDLSGDTVAAEDAWDAVSRQTEFERRDLQTCVAMNAGPTRLVQAIQSAVEAAGSSIVEPTVTDFALAAGWLDADEWSKELFEARDYFRELAGLGRPDG